MFGEKMAKKTKVGLQAEETTGPMKLGKKLVCVKIYYNLTDHSVLQEQAKKAGFSSVGLYLKANEQFAREFGQLREAKRKELRTLEEKALELKKTYFL